MKDDSIIAIQDMGAAGLHLRVSKWPLKCPWEQNLFDQAPCREENMSPYEMMLSESQERMLIILEDGKEDYARNILKMDLDFVIIGKTNKQKFNFKFNNKLVGEIPIDALASKAPIYNRKLIKKQLPKKRLNIKSLKKIKLEDALKNFMYPIIQIKVGLQSV